MIPEMLNESRIGSWVGSEMRINSITTAGGHHGGQKWASDGNGGLII